MSTLVALRLLFHHTRIFINEVGLHAIAPLEVNILPGMTLTGICWYASPERSDSLIRCLQATKEYLDYFLVISPEAIVYFSMPVFIHLIYAVLILGSIATTSNSPRLDAAHIRRVAEFENYIGALSQKTLQVIGTTSETDGAHGHLSNLHHLWQKSGPWYSQVISSSGTASYSTLGCPDFSFMEIFSTTIRRCS